MSDEFAEEVNEIAKKIIIATVQAEAKYDTLKAENARLREALESIANAHVTWYERTPESILSGCRNIASEALKGGK